MSDINQASKDAAKDREIAQQEAELTRETHRQEAEKDRELTRETAMSAKRISRWAIGVAILSLLVSIIGIVVG